MYKLILTTIVTMSLFTMVACKSSPKVDPVAVEQARKMRFNKALASATTEINQVRIAEARGYLSQARNEANTAIENRKVQSLDSLLMGAEAMMKGDLDGARKAWSAIQDPYLQKELRNQAARQGFKVSLVK